MSASTEAATPTPQAQTAASARVVSVTSAQLARLREGLCPDQVVLAEAELRDYAIDHTEDLVHLPAIALLPESTAQVAAIVKTCAAEGIPITTRGAGSGLAGGCLPVCGGVVVSTARMNRILAIDERNLQVRTQPGVITEELQNAVAARGLFYPVDPASRGWCTIGGNVGTNAGGPRAVKYGVVRDYVLNLEVVLATGEVIWTGADTLKNSTGYNVTQLMVGSEGTLGIVTEIVLRLLPRPTHDLLLLVPFARAEDACAAVAAIFSEGVIPSAIEFMERTAIELAAAYTHTAPVPGLHDDTAAQLLIEVDGTRLEPLMEDCETIAAVVERHGAGEVLFADSEALKRELWNLRRNVGQAVKLASAYKEEDTVVPRAELPALLRLVKEIGGRYGFESVCYGHAGDGNLHVNILRGTLSDRAWTQELPRAIRELFAGVRALGGTISGEHGVGLVQRRYLDIVFTPPARRLQAAIKAAFDPAGILNPDKVTFAPAVGTDAGPVA